MVASTGRDRDGVERPLRNQKEFDKEYNENIGNSVNGMGMKSTSPALACVCAAIMLMAGCSNEPAKQESSPAPQSASAPPPSIQGFLDGADCQAVGGWAFNLRAPNDPVEIVLLDNDKPVTRVKAEALREDLVRARVGDGRHAFTVATPVSLKDNRRHQITASVGATGIVLAGSPKTIGPCQAK